VGFILLMERMITCEWEDLFYNYWRAMMNRQYELFKWYCMPDGVWEHKTDELEDCINANSESEDW